jgi:hypothetical protein
VTIASQLQDLRNTLLPATDQNIMERQSNFEFVCQYKNPEYYLPRCFPTLFPYGRGCPSDRSSSTTNIRKHTIHMLSLGGGPNPRRFQQSLKYVFSIYIMEMKRKNGGIAYAAQKKKNNDKPTENEILPTVGDINNLRQYLDSTNNINVSGKNLTVSQSITSNDGYEKNIGTPKIDEKEMLKLIHRLVPYSKSLQGTALHIAFERSKLMAMLPSPIMKKSGNCRWFLTMAPSDRYENRTIEVIQDSIVDDSVLSWDQRTNKVNTYNLFDISFTT